MSIYQCNACGRLTEAANVERHGSRCGVRLSGSTWCQGTYIEHGCGGPKEACGADGCQECGGSRATGDIDLHARVASLTAEVERLKGREAFARPFVERNDVDSDGDETCPECGNYVRFTSGSEHECPPTCPRAAWLAGCKS